MYTWHVVIFVNYSSEACPLAVLENYGYLANNFRLILLLMTCGVENLARCCNAYVTQWSTL